MRTRFVLPAIVGLLAAGLADLAGQTTGSTPELDPTGNTGALKAQIATGGSYDAHSGNATRTVTDLHVPGALSAYGLDFSRHFNSLQMNYDDGAGAFDVPSGFGWSPFGHSWQWSATEEDIYPTVTLGTGGEGGGPGEQTNNIFTTAINILFPDGHTTQFKIARVGTGQWLVPAGYPQFGPPYTEAERNQFAYGGTGVHDHLCHMNADATDFYLCLADGGSVHFINFQAREVFDPHGLRTELRYKADDGSLEYVIEEGGRFLKLTYGAYGGGAVITKVEGGSGPDLTGINQSVTYEYVYSDGTAYPGNSTSALVLQHAVYSDEPAPGQVVRSTYSYGTCWGDEAEPCQFPNGAPIPLLKHAYDPHFAGPMTTIRYNYRGVRCPKVVGDPLYHPDYYRAQPYAIAAEKSCTGIAVSTFQIDCEYGTRVEFNGLGGTRGFYFGTSAGTCIIGPGRRCQGYQLGRVTDFAGYLSSNTPSHRQNFLWGQPNQIWDGRNIMTEEVPGTLDESGMPAQINYADTSHSSYNRTDPGASAPLDTAHGMHNDYNHWLFSHTDELGRVTTYIRDGRRRVTRIEYDGGSAEEFTYNDFNQVTSHTLPSVMQNGQHPVVTFVYDSAGRLQSESNSVDGLDARKSYTYDSLGRVLTVCDGRARANSKDFSTRMTYNGRHQVIMVEYAGMFASTAANNPHVTYGYDANGNCTSITDEMGHTSLYTYDLYRRCTSYTEPLNVPDAAGTTLVSRRWDWVYDRYVVDDNFNPNYKDLSAHTANEWRIQVEPAYNDPRERPITHRFHDVNNRVVFQQTGWIQRPDPAPLGDWYWSGRGESIYYSYDENGQKKTYTDPLGRVTTYDYDNRNRLWKTNETVNTIPRTTETLYDYAGNKTRVNFPVEAGGQRFQRWLDYDVFGQPRQFIDERNNITDLNYWDWGPMKKLAQVITHRAKDGGGTENQLTAFYYDAMGRPQTTVFPDGASESSSYEYGQLKSFKTRKDQTKYIHYDARGREDSNSWQNQSGTCNPGTDTGAADCIVRQWDAANRLGSIQNKVATIVYSYDDASQVKTESESITGAGGPGLIEYRRFGNGTVWNIFYPNGMRVSRNYTAELRLRAMWDHGPNNWQSVISYTYTDDGKVDHADYANGVTTSYGYDGRGMINLVRNSRSSTELSRRDYYRDERDRIAAFRKGTSSANPMENGRGDRFRYDAEGQLVEAWYNAADPANSGAGNTGYDVFSYDEMGNRKDWAFVASKGWMHYLRRDNGLNQYSSWENNYPTDDPAHWGSGIFEDDNLPNTIAPGWQYPGNGVTMAEGNLIASYNALNQPVAMIPTGSSDVTWFGYDPLGRCVKRTVGAGLNNGTGIYLYYDGWNLIQEGPSAGYADRQYIHGARVDEIVKQIKPPSGLERYFHYDARGHCTMQTDGGGAIAEQYAYFAFGSPYFYDGAANEIGYSPWGNRFLFTGREWLSSLKIYDYRNRMYQPELGRFLQPDPKQFAAGDYNLYRYCHNDPINKSDPTGLLWRFVDQSGKTDAALKREFERVRARMSENPALKGIFDRVASDTAHTVTVVRSNAIGRKPDQFKGYESGNASFEWNPRAASSFANGSQSPATVLLHEAAHADHYLLDKQGTANAFRTGDGPRGSKGSFNNLEERGVITGPEAAGAALLHENPRDTNSGTATTYSVNDLFGR